MSRLRSTERMARRRHRVKVYGAPISNDFYQIGDAPNGALFVSAFSIQEDDTGNLWYEIHYNKRVAPLS